MLLPPSILVLLEAQPPRTHFVRLRRCPASEPYPALLPRLSELVSESSACPLGSPPGRMRNREPMTFRIPRERHANEPSTAASFNPGM
jgi:hypothetical protein